MPVAGILLGAGFGGLQLYLLILAVGALGTRGLKILPLVVQFFCPFAGLGLCAAVARTQLLACAITMSAVLVGGAAVCFLRARMGDKKGKKD